MSDTAVLSFPLKGISVAKRPPGHHPLALDLAGLASPASQLTTSGRLRWLASRTPAESYHGWSMPIHGPGKGVVVAAADGQADRVRTGAVNTVALLIYATFIFKPQVSESGQPDIQPNVGNHVMVQIAPAQVAFYAHLQQGSVDVAVGDEVSDGSVLARLGNSGNTTAPHLHIHVLDQMDDLNTAELVPFVFASYERWDGSRWHRQTESLPKPGQILRN
ncbi:MAG: M23 family metallopeptidase [Actinobacteria bacterium]|nr:M23 family metallopeptidase [Actinomycetota bacterium]